MSRLSRQQGFTLIELIMVIVILGILAVVGIPKYADMKREAIIATMKGLNGAVQSAANIAYAKAVVTGVEKRASATITVNGTVVQLVYGYPDGTAAGIPLMVSAPADGWKSRASTYAGAWVYWHGTIAEDAGVAQCYIRYRQATAAGARPVVDFQDSGC